MFNIAYFVQQKKVKVERKNIIFNVFSFGFWAPKPFLYFPQINLANLATWSPFYAFFYLER